MRAAKHFTRHQSFRFGLAGACDPPRPAAASRGGPPISAFDRDRPPRFRRSSRDQGNRLRRPSAGENVAIGRIARRGQGQTRSPGSKQRKERQHEIPADEPVVTTTRRRIDADYRKRSYSKCRGDPGPQAFSMPSCGGCNRPVPQQGQPVPRRSPSMGARAAGLTHLHMHDAPRRAASIRAGPPPFTSMTMNGGTSLRASNGLRQPPQLIRGICGAFVRIASASRIRLVAAAFHGLLGP